jgi:tetratricopeptide (TPR) repeat protein
MNDMSQQAAGKIKCVICYGPIAKKPGSMEPATEDDLVKCPGGHRAHYECLKGWILTSRTCPACSLPYDKEVLIRYVDFVKEEKAKRAQERVKKEEEEVKKKEEDAIKNKLVNQLFDLETAKQVIEAQKLAAQGENTQALKILWDIMDNTFKEKRTKGALEVLMLIGRINYRAGKYGLALKPITEVVKVDMKFPLAMYYMGLAYDKLGMPDKMIWSFERAIDALKGYAEKNPTVFQPFVDYVQKKLDRKAELSAG